MDKVSILERLLLNMRNIVIFIRKNYMIGYQRLV